MATLEFRTLTADEIDCRVQSVSEKGCVVLLYKNARVDMKLLDEVVGAKNWQREHQMIGDRLYCTISIWDDEKKQWIKKQDVGTESNTEPEKGQASDSFKRACFNIGIGRELYTAPFVWIALRDDEKNTDKGRWAVNTDVRFSVSEISYTDDHRIKSLTIVDQTNEERYTFPRKRGNFQKKPTPAPTPAPTPQPAPEQKQCSDLMKAAREEYKKAKTGADLNIIWKKYKQLMPAGEHSELQSEMLQYKQDNNIQ